MKQKLFQRSNQNAFAKRLISRTEEETIDRTGICAVRGEPQTAAVPDSPAHLGSEAMAVDAVDEAV
jgi:hypothetical protein